ncbi:MAG: class I tRNA ligase family protein [Candidatus Paceibacterota bacterium]
MKEYNHLKIEKKIQENWKKKEIYKAKDFKGKKYYSLIEFPYPSGDGLHVGHVRGQVAMDIVSRKRRMEGYNVLYPIGWDAFGLPTENYAIKTGKRPKVITKKNTDTFRKQAKSLGISFDWSREINTTDPAYYKWTQWIFLQFYKKGLAYKAEIPINWCPRCKIGLANEEVVDGKCERCGEMTERRMKNQWMLAITKYAERLDKDLDLVDYPERVKSSQRNWIGKSEGSEIDFKITLPKNSEKLLSRFSHSNLTTDNESNIAYKAESTSQNFLGVLKVFTTRADTLFGVTYVVLAPEHDLVQKLLPNILNKNEVSKFIDEIKKKSELERTGENKEKIGIELKGIKATNPANGEEVPIWIADYVLANYGTGAVMAVPQHDTRDRDFAEKYNLPIIDRPLVDIQEITKKVGGKMVTKFKLRDWVFSRQRYWGEPIPLVNCDKCGLVPLSEKDLPLKLPEVKKYTLTETGESPLAGISKWVNTKCPKCKGKAKRETDTMPNWAGSSWYYLRYIDPKNKNKFVDPKKLNYWSDVSNKDLKAKSYKLKAGPVDWYNGGMEHTTLHLLYSRFWHKFLYDLKLVPMVEPYKKRTSHGMILGAGGVKMSKSLGNVVNPDDIIKTYGADTLRVYEMFLGPFEDGAIWNTESIIGSRRFIEKVWRIGEKIVTKQTNNFRNCALGDKRTGDPHVSENCLSASSLALKKLLHKTIKKVGEDIESMHFNTAISSMMILATEMEKSEFINTDDFKKFLQILAPFAPHMTEELYKQLTINNYELKIKKEKIISSIHLSSWPKYDENLIKDDEVKIAIQVNGKVRAEIMIQVSESEEIIKEKALKNEAVLRFINGAEIRKVIYVKNRLINIVI